MRSEFRKSLVAVAVGLAMFAASAIPAAAQTTIQGSDIWAAVMPIVATVATGIVTVAVTFATVLIKRKFSIDIEAKHREALHQALQTGVDLAIARVGARVENMDVQIQNRVVGQAAMYVVKSVPDALKALKVPDYGDQLTEMVVAKIEGKKAKAATDAAPASKAGG